MLLPRKCEEIINVGMIGIVAGFLGKPTVRWLLAYKRFIGECSWGQHLEKGR